jgi:FtsH-binding integral membrane protein
MADYDNRVLRVPSAAAELYDAGLRAHMLRVYNYMLSGLVLTGLTSFGTYALSVTDNPANAAVQLRNGQMLTHFGVTLFASPLMWLLVLAPLGLVLFLSFRINKMSVQTARLTFWGYAALLGVSFGSIFMTYTYASIAQVFFIAAAMFGGMSLWGYTTKRDLTGFGSFLFMGLIGLIIAMVVGFFFQSTVLQFVISVAGVLIFTGLTAYDTQKIKEMYVANMDGTMAGRGAIMGALALYLDFINLFLMLLRLMGDRR